MFGEFRRLSEARPRAAEDSIARSLAVRTPSERLDGKGEVWAEIAP